MDNFFIVLVAVSVLLAFMPVFVLLAVFLTKRYYFIDQRGPKFDRWIRVFKFGAWPGIFEKQIKEKPDCYYRRNVYPWGSGCICQEKISNLEIERHFVTSRETDFDRFAKD